jgi:predicted secreted protein
MIGLVKDIASSILATIGVILAVSGAGIAIAVHAFDLRLTGATALYFVIWWILLFAVLPFGVTSQHESGEIVAGTEPGAPAAPGLREKALWTTFVSAPVLVFVSAVLPLSGL